MFKPNRQMEDASFPKSERKIFSTQLQF